MKAIVIFSTSVILSIYLWSVNSGIPNSRPPINSVVINSMATSYKVKSVSRISVKEDKKTQLIVVEYNVESLKLKLKMRRKDQADYSFSAEFSLAESVYEKIDEFVSLQLNVGAFWRNAGRN